MKKQASVMMVNCRGRILLLHRTKGSPRPGTFCFPGGHLNFGEDFATAAIRETREETGMALNPNAVKDTGGAWNLPHALIHAFRIDLDTALPPVTLSFEHDGYLWVDPKEDWVHQLPFTGQVVRDMLAAMR